MDARTVAIRGALTLAQPLQYWRARSPWLEARLGLPLTDADHAAITRVLERDGRRLGSYYHWYLEKALVARGLKHANRKRVLATAAAADRTDYAGLDKVFDDPAGLVLALPHFGNYILAIVRMFVRYGRKRRDIGVFYAAPGTSQGNEVFDFIYSICFKSDPESRTRVFHADRTGLGEAMKLLKAGGALVMMPDVSLQPDDAYLVSFLGRTFDAMLGSASLARRSHARLVPLLAQRVGNLAFATHAGEPITKSACAVPEDSKFRNLAADYLATAKLFETYEAWMKGQEHLWQPIREHFSKTEPFQDIDPSRLDKIWPMFWADPRVQPSNTTISI